MKILISGAGIAGLSFAGFLRKNNVEVDIIDRSHAFTHMGYGIILMPSGMRILNKLGVGAEITNHSFKVDRFTILDQHGKRIQLQNLKEISNNTGDFYTIPREDLHTTLENTLAAKSVIFNTTVKTLYQNSEKVNVTLSNGDQKTYDLLVCAEGVKSDIRKKVFRVEPSYYNYSVWLGWLKRDLDISNKVSFIVGNGVFMFYMPLSNNKSVVSLFAKHKPGKDASTDFKTYFKDFIGPGKVILDNIREHEQMFYDDIRKVRPEDWYKNRVVLMGDAEHAMTPLTGMGSTLALEDAFVLYDELSAVDFDKTKLHIALERYAHRRQPRVSQVESFSDSLMNLGIRNSLLTIIRDKILQTDMSREFIGHEIEKVLTCDI